MFADYNTLFSSNLDINIAVENVQKVFDTASKCFYNNGLKLNVAKTHAFTFCLIKENANHVKLL